MNDKQKKQLRSLLKSNSNLSKKTIEYIITNTNIEDVPHYYFSNGGKRVGPFLNDIDKYIKYFFNQECNQQVLIDNNEVVNRLITKFKVGDTVWVLNRAEFVFQRLIINEMWTSVDAGIAHTSVSFKHPLDDKEDSIIVSCLCDYYTDTQLFHSLEDALDSLKTSSVNYEERYKWDLLKSKYADEERKYSDE